MPCVRFFSFGGEYPYRRFGRCSGALRVLPDSLLSDLKLVKVRPVFGEVMKNYRNNRMKKVMRISLISDSRPGDHCAGQCCNTFRQGQYHSFDSQRRPPQHNASLLKAQRLYPCPDNEFDNFEINLR